MIELDAETALTAAASWVWVPDDAVRVETEDYLLVAFPTYYPSPTQLPRTHSSRPAKELVAEVRGQLDRLGRSQVEWCVPDAVRPAGLGEALLAAGASLHEELQVLARPIPEETAESEVEVRQVTDGATLADWYGVQTAVFGGVTPDADVLERDLRRESAGAEAGTSLSVVAYVDGAPVGAAGTSLVDGWARLWGGATLVRARGRGVYRALLEARMAWAGGHGAHAALVKGRVDTSAPILARTGFTAYGEERWYLLEA